MAKVSVNILTKNRAQLLARALASVGKQSFTDFEVVAVDDASADETQKHLETPNTKYQIPNKFQIINHQISRGISISRQEALLASSGRYIAILDDDDEWVDIDKLKKQVEFLDTHPDYVLVGGAIRFKISDLRFQNGETAAIKYRPKEEEQIRKTMLFRNNFFTSTAMFRRQAAVSAGGFIKDEYDLAEDYDLWLRLGKMGKMYNFQEVFANYRQPEYNKEKFLKFLQKQALLVFRRKRDYPFYVLAAALLKFRMKFKI